MMREDLQASGGSGPSEGAYVYGLYLEGAGWDKRNSRLTECSPKVLHTPMPLVHVFAINADRPKGTYSYRVSKRTSCVVYSYCTCTLCIRITDWSHLTYLGFTPYF